MGCVSYKLDVVQFHSPIWQHYHNRHTNILMCVQTNSLSLYDLSTDVGLPTIYLFVYGPRYRIFFTYHKPNPNSLGPRSGLCPTQVWMTCRRSCRSLPGASRISSTMRATWKRIWCWILKFQLKNTEIWSQLSSSLVIFTYIFADKSWLGKGTTANYDSRIVL